ncbi:hypothetical protein K435DRAFT_967284 [Dendrothele bispora CBS 962.96]|uniref:Uncharacterized protein n=1 Tax=Dendrothele bispora (strain CBS 962.96) TaxID=1314807 RepID=A0A4S8LW89_DENBC|nr:hypothetical protein K435DRAFT_967284 [Dendrothele bispora CBS 962.96]
MPNIDLIVRLEYTPVKSQMFADAPLSDIARRLDQDLDRFDLPQPRMKDIWVSNNTRNALCCSFRTNRYSSLYDRICRIVRRQYESGWIRDLKNYCCIKNICIYEEDVREEWEMSPKTEPLDRAYRSPAGSARSSRRSERSLSPVQRSPKDKFYPASTGSKTADQFDRGQTDTELFLSFQYASQKAQWFSRHTNLFTDVVLQDFEFLKFPQPAREVLQIDGMSDSINFSWKMKKPSAIYNQIRAFVTEQNANKGISQKKRACQILTVTMREEEVKSERETNNSSYPSSSKPILDDVQKTKRIRPVQDQEDIDESSGFVTSGHSRTSVFAEEHSVAQSDTLPDNLFELEYKLGGKQVKDEKPLPSEPPFKSNIQQKGGGCTSSSVLATALGCSLQEREFHSVGSNVTRMLQERAVVNYPESPIALGSNVTPDSVLPTDNPFFNITNQPQGVDVNSPHVQITAGLQSSSSLAATCTGVDHQQTVERVLETLDEDQDSNIQVGSCAGTLLAEDRNQRGTFLSPSTPVEAPIRAITDMDDHSISIPCDSGSKNTELISGLTKAFWSATHSLNTLSARALVLKGMLQDLGIGDSVFREDCLINESCYTLAKTKTQLRREQAECARLESIVGDVKRECEDPVVVPALLAGFGIPTSDTC